jgi:hypothetical protein
LDVRDYSSPYAEKKTTLIYFGFRTCLENYYFDF